MSYRALITGIGVKYEDTGGVLSPLKAEEDLNKISDILSSKNWDSIDHIDDNDKTILDRTDNRIKTGKTILPSKENILETITNILQIDPTTKILFFYFTGHGVKDGGLFMVTYDKEYFDNTDINHPPDTLLSDDNYISAINAQLEKYISLQVITVIDCCYAGCLIDSAKQADKFLDRHIIFCAVSSRLAARGPEKSASFFTGNFCRAAKETKTYLELKNKLLATSGSYLPAIYIANSLNDILHPL